MPTITLRGTAAADAQTLVRLLAEENIPVSPVSEADTSRGVGEVAGEVVIGLLTHAGYDASRAAVLRWVRARQLKDEDVTVDPDPDDEEPDDGPGSSTS